MTGIGTSRPRPWSTEREFLAAFLATLGAAVAPVTIVAVNGVFEGWFDPSLVGVGLLFLLVTWIFALPHLIVAMPLYVLLRRFGWVNWGTAALAGLIIGVVPLGLIGFGDRLTILLTAAAGLAGGLTFRAALGRPWVWQ